MESILTQSHREWELIAVDDHSTDESLTILESFQEKDPRVHIYSNNGKGIIAALRLAFRHSTGEYITRMDADDYMHPEKLRTLLQTWQISGRKSVAIGGVEYFSDAQLGEGYKKYADWLNGLTATDTHFEEIYKECVVPSPCWLMHREDLIECGAFEPNRYPEDYDLCFRMYVAGFKTIGNETPIHYWRDHTDRSSRTMEVYRNNGFFELKVHYFLKIDRHKDHPLLLWGTGKKGKQIAQLLLQHNQNFVWITNNAKKIGKDIYGIIVQDYTKIDWAKELQLIVAVSQPDGIMEIKKYLRTKNISKEQVFFFM